MQRTLINVLCMVYIKGVFCAQTTVNECRLSDIKNMIGGQDYTIDEMRGIHFVHK